MFPIITLVGTLQLVIIISRHAFNDRSGGKDVPVDCSVWLWPATSTLNIIQRSRMDVRITISFSDCNTRMLGYKKKGRIFFYLHSDVPTFQEDSVSFLSFSVSINYLTSRDLYGRSRLAWNTLIHVKQHVIYLWLVCEKFICVYKIYICIITNSFPPPKKKFAPGNVTNYLNCVCHGGEGALG